MLLRRLELCGFKSFANRMKLEFGPGITALVGPNGSGKSNIADAIRWALGEQRLKSLRCEKIEDLIHLSPDTVSYTHLDVYKRQVLTNTVPRGLAKSYLF